MLPMALFTLASILPLPLFLAGVVEGGTWLLVGLIYMTLFAASLDQFVGWVAPDAPEGAEFPAADALLVVLGGAHLVAFPVAVWAVAGGSGLGLWERAVVFMAFGLWFGQVSNPAAHELIHRGDRNMFRLGAAVYSSMLFGHHSSSHRLIHHRHAASRQDPNTARSGEGYYRFLLRAWVGSFQQGWVAEAERQAGHGGSTHPYAWYLGGAALGLGVGWILAGPAGLAVWFALSAHAQCQLLLSDYVQHYGLVRARRADGRLEPVGARHSWNAPHWFSSALMLNAPRHSDHHAHPGRPYPALRLPAEDVAPRLPFALPICCLIALMPSLWKRMMEPHVRAWRVA